MNNAESLIENITSSSEFMKNSDVKNMQEYYQEQKKSFATVSQTTSEFQPTSKQLKQFKVYQD